MSTSQFVAEPDATGQVGSWKLEVGSCSLFLVHRADRTLLVISAMRTDAVRCLGLVALRTEAGRGHRQRVVRAPFRGAGFRMSTFWIRHLYRSLRAPGFRLRAPGLPQTSRVALASTVAARASVLRVCLHRARSPKPGARSPINQDSLFSPFSAASRGSSHTGAQSQEPRFRFVPHCEHRPLQSSWHNGFIGSAR